MEKLNTTRELVIIPFTEMLAQISGRIIYIFDEQVISNGVILQHLGNDFSVSIESGCNGVEALMVLVSAILLANISNDIRNQPLEVSCFIRPLLPAKVVNWVV